MGGMGGRIGVDDCDNVMLPSKFPVPFTGNKRDKIELSLPRLSFSGAGLIFRRILLMLLPGINI